jgi:hypothetical protein
MNQPEPSNIVPFPGKPKRSTKFVPPTIEEAQLHGAKIGCPPSEVDSYWFYYQSKGWKVGKEPMKCWKAALSGWNVRFRSRQAEWQSTPSSGMNLMLRRDELKRVEEKMRVIKASYSENLSWDEKDKNMYRCLKTRRDQILKILGMTI